MTDLLSLQPRLSVEAPGSPVTSVRNAILKAYNYIATRVPVHVHVLPDITLVAGNPSVTLPSVPGFSVVGVVAASVNGKCLSCIGSVPDCAAPGFGVSYTDPSEIKANCGFPGSLRKRGSSWFVHPCPDNLEAYTLSISAQLRAVGSSGSVNLPDDVFHEVEDAVFHRAASQLLAEQDENWSDTRRSAYHARLASFEFSNVRANVNRRSMSGALVARGGRWL